MMIDTHLAALTRTGFRPRTIAQRKARLTAFIAASGVTLDAATREEITAYLDTFEHPQTRSTYLSHLRAFYKWCIIEGLLERDPTAGIPSPRIPRRLPRPISEADLTRALAGAPALERAWITLSAYAGLRACEIAPMRGEHVRRGGTPYLFIPEQKGGQEATVPLSSRVLGELDAWPTTGWMWQSLGPLEPDAVSMRVGALFRRLGIAASLHQCRHRFGTMTYRASGHDLRVTQELMRHASPTSTALYTAVDPSEGSRVVELLD
jgi:integrase